MSHATTVDLPCYAVIEIKRLQSCLKTYNPFNGTWCLCCEIANGSAATSRSIKYGDFEQFMKK